MIVANAGLFGELHDTRHEDGTHTLSHSIGFTFVRHRNGNLTIHRPDGTPLPWPGQNAA